MKRHLCHGKWFESRDACPWHKDIPLEVSRGLKRWRRHGRFRSPIIRLEVRVVR